MERPSRVAVYRELLIRKFGHADRKPDAFNPPTDAELDAARRDISDFEAECLRRWFADPGGGPPGILGGDGPHGPQGSTAPSLPPT